MKWFRSPRVVALEAQVDILRARVAEALNVRDEATAREKYWRERYERVADAMLFRHGDINAPLHVDPKPLSGSGIGAQVARIANVIGQDRGIKFETVQRG